MRRAIREPLAICLLVGLVGSCGGLASVDAPLDVSTCQNRWNVLLQASDNVWVIQISTSGSGLSWTNGQLYFQYADWKTASGDQNAIAGISTSDSSPFPANVATIDPLGWWIENDQLIYVDGNLVLNAMPLAGVAQPTPLVDLSQGTPNAYYFGFVLDTEAVYWVSLDWAQSATATGWSVWRALRSTGERQQLAIMPRESPTSGTGSRLTLTQDSVMADNGLRGIPGGIMYVVPKVGGAPRVLPSPSYGSLLATSSDGVVLWLELLKGGQTYKMWRATADGAAPTPFWTDKPPELFLVGGWSDSNGGWYLAAAEYTSPKHLPDTEHNSIWSLDSSGRSTRRACNPTPGTVAASAFALSPTNLFLLDLGISSSDTTSVVSIAR
jgi:hypothetical protein